VRKAILHPLKYHGQAVIPTVGLVRDGRPVLLPAWKLKVLTQRCACDFRIPKVGICLQGQVLSRICFAVPTNIAQSARSEHIVYFISSIVFTNLVSATFHAPRIQDVLAMFQISALPSCVKTKQEFLS
jgi:hypothetical protein